MIYLQTQIHWSLKRCRFTTSVLIKLNHREKNGLTSSDGDLRHDPAGDDEDEDAGNAGLLHGFFFTNTIITTVEEHAFHRLSE